MQEKIIAMQEEVATTQKELSINAKRTQQATKKKCQFACHY